MPPLAEVVDTLTNVVLPASVATAIVFLIVVLLVYRFARDRQPLAAAVLAVVFGVVAGNHLRGAIEFRIDSEQVLTPAAMATAVRDTFVPPESDDAPLPPPSRYWLPWTAGLAMLGGLVTRIVPAFVAWPIRIVLAAVATALLVPADLRESARWFAPLFLTVVLAEWVVLERVGGRSQHDGEKHAVCDWLVPLAAGIAFGAACIVLLHAHSARFVDIATIAAACLGTIALLAWLTDTDSSSVAPGVAVLLPGLMLVGQQDTFSEVPIASFATIALAPLTLAPLLFPNRRHHRWKLPLVAALLLAVLAVGVGLAMRAESLSFG